jgi:Na+-transporting methylmalonyl-CoA/oxaloacetate decarboxylase gamma subunit
MVKYLAIVFVLLILLAVAGGCMREAEVCNYDAVCTNDETDECADCKNVVGRDVTLNTADESSNLGDSP